MRKLRIDAGYFGAWIDARGRTNLATTYPTRTGQARNGSGGSTGLFTLKRPETRSKARAVNAILRELTPGRSCYLITHTMAPHYDHYARRDHWNRFIDRFRKLPEVYAYQWMTELHPGTGENAGTIHHHMVAVMRKRWNYNASIQGWSQRYSGSCNGLDVLKLSRNEQYVVDDLCYVEKTLREEGHCTELPFRWWGCSQNIKRNALVDGPVEGVEVRQPFYGHSMLRVSYRDAARYCAEATRKHIKRKDREAVARKQGIKLRPSKTKYEQVWVDNWSPEMLPERFEVVRLPWDSGKHLPDPKAR